MESCQIKLMLCDVSGQLPHKQKVVIAGNHELTMDIDLVCAKRHMLQDHFSISEEARCIEMMFKNFFLGN